MLDPFNLLYIEIHISFDMPVFPQFIVILDVWVHTGLIDLYGLFNGSLSHVHVNASLTLFQVVVQLYNGNVLPCSVTDPFLEGKEGKGLLNCLCFTEKQISFTTVFCKLQAHSKGHGMKNRKQMGTLYLECCKAKVHFLYVAYSKRIERSICLHMVTVIWIWGSLSPVGHWCSRLMILQKADLSETLKVPVHFGGWAVMTLPKTESTPLRRTGWGFLTSPFLLFMVRSSDVWQGNLGLIPVSKNGLSRTRVTSWKHSCTSRSEGVCGKQGEALKGCLEEGVRVVCRSHWKLSSSGVHGDQSWYPAIDSPKRVESEHGISLAWFWWGYHHSNSHLSYYWL